MPKKPLKIDFKPSRAATQRTFAAHFFHGGGVRWEDTSSMGGSGTPAHSLTLYMSPHWKSPQRREVLGFIAAALLESKSDWFSLVGNRWRVDYDKMRAFFKLGREFEWLTGNAFVDPEYDTTTRPAAFSPERSETHPLVTLVFERDSLQQTLESDEDRRSRVFDSMKFHPDIAATCRARFVAGQSDDAIFQGCLRVNAVVQARTGSLLDGDALFGSVFSSETPQLKLTPCQTSDEKNEQAGFRFLFQGMAKAIRNPRGHRVLGVDETVTIEHLAFLSLLLRFLDAAK